MIPNGSRRISPNRLCYLFPKQHRTMGAAGFGGAFAPLCGAALIFLTGYSCGSAPKAEAADVEKLLRKLGY